MQDDSKQMPHPEAFPGGPEVVVGDEPLAMRQEPVGLHHELEGVTRSRRLGPPSVPRGLRRNAVEGGVQLAGVELRRVAIELLQASAQA